MELEDINARHKYIDNRIKQIHKELKDEKDESQSRKLQNEMGSLTYEDYITLSEEAKRSGYVFYRYGNVWQLPGVSEDRIQELIKQYLIGYGPNSGDCEVCDRYESGKCKPRGMSVYSFDLCPIVEERLKELEDGKKE